jgi:nitroreductase
MIIDPILKRRAVREYDDKSVPDELVADIIKAAQFAPTAMNNKSVEFVVLKKKENINKLYDLIEFKQEYLRQVPVILIPTINTAKSTLPVQDLSVATENIFIEAAALGLGTVWKNIEPETAEEIKTYLGIPANFMVINVIPLGYPKSVPQPHNDEEFSENKIHYEKW